MPAIAEPTWEDAKAQGRERYFMTVNAGLRALFYERLLRYKALLRICKDPRDTLETVSTDFPDAWSKPSRWYYDFLLEEKRHVARNWMHGRPAGRPMPNTLLNHFLGGVHGR